VESSVNENIKILIETIDSNPNDFAKQIGLKRADVIYNIISNKTKASTEIIELITNKFEKLNIRWLFTGHGEIFIDNNYTSIINEPEVPYGNKCKNCECLKHEIERLKEIIELKDELLEVYRPKKENRLTG